jgi:hypothetical protein
LGERRTPPFDSWTGVRKDAKRPTVAIPPLRRSNTRRGRYDHHSGYRCLASFWAKLAAICLLFPALILFDDVSVMTSIAGMVCGAGHA